ncbi:ubiquinone/menaquinone biosynthesis C-methylase UbiE [Parvibaculum indicum]|uniref:class I SAM-dependent methyltransferase n=1 Tax=Parvibaculum indicum TaxID=562969 RepID=UPI0014245973|nr:class I SAM-dependent methyltransferase [Parvibaculum indicum]NIJ42427.1 ubiquinone/menaquinone biosynthesis C-methylase UbiE [Parvibaculum indicum]
MSEADAAFWDRAARKYAKSPVADMAGFDRTLARTRELLPPAASVLELGCGTGTAALRLADAAQRYLATDISAEMIAIAKEKAEAAAADGTRPDFRQATARELAAEGTRYDAVLGFNYLHLVSDVPEALRDIGTLLRPGGLFISKTPCLGDMNPLIGLAIPVMRLFGKAPSSVASMTAASLAEAIRAAGFDILAEERHGSEKKDTRPFIAARAGD